MDTNEIKYRVESVKIEAKYRLNRLKERALLAFVWALPLSIVYWCGIRMVAEVSATDKFAKVPVPDITAMDVIGHFERG